MRARARRLDTVTAKFLGDRQGLAARIMSLAHVDHSYVSRVLSGRKPPSLRFLRALDWSLSEYIVNGAQARLYRAILRQEHPEIDGTESSKSKD